MLFFLTLLVYTVPHIIVFGAVHGKLVDDIVMNQVRNRLGTNGRRTNHLWSHV